MAQTGLSMRRQSLTPYPYSRLAPMFAGEFRAFAVLVTMVSMERLEWTAQT